MFSKLALSAAIVISAAFPAFAAVTMAGSQASAQQQNRE
jgi:hypothetical protein